MHNILKTPHLKQPFWRPNSLVFSTSYSLNAPLFNMRNQGRN